MATTIRTFTGGLDAAYVLAADARDRRTAELADRVAGGDHSEGTSAELLTLCARTAELADLDLGVVLRRELWLAEERAARDHRSVRVPEIPACDFCGEPAVADGRTRIGPWAWMCELHLRACGVGLGLGRGQRLVLGTENEGSEAR
jgi:hypothetical protein